MMEGRSMKRLSTVALGVALCTLATAAGARPGDAPHTRRDGYPQYADGHRETWRPRAKRRAALRRPGRRHTARLRPRHHLVGRSFARFARGGTSRTCLTPAARTLLDRIEAQFGAVRIVSTCRPGAVIASSGRPSRHASGNAVDFNAPAGRRAEVVRWLIANHRSGGVMTYAAMSHIHVDIGRRFVALNAGRRRWR
jgi:hypothetical protein